MRVLEDGKWNNPAYIHNNIRRSAVPTQNDQVMSERRRRGRKRPLLSTRREIKRERARSFLGRAETDVVSGVVIEFGMGFSIVTTSACDSEEGY